MRTVLSTYLNMSQIENPYAMTISTLKNTRNEITLEENCEEVRPLVLDYDWINEGGD